MVLSLIAEPKAAGAQKKDPHPAIPSLDEMAGEWTPMKAVASPPAIHNLHDILLSSFDLVSFSYNPGYSILLNLQQERRMYPSIRLFVGDAESPATESRWFPYKVLRRNPDCAGLSVETDLRMLKEQGAALCRIRLSNPRRAAIKTALRLEMPARLHSDGLTALRDFSHGYSKTSMVNSVVAVSPVQKPDAVRGTGEKVAWTWEVVLQPGEERVLEFAGGNGLESARGETIQRVREWGQNFDREFEGFRKAWEQRWADAFTPGNSHYSGHLPVLTTENADLRRNYYMGVLTVLALERSRYPAHPRTWVTNGERPLGQHYFWDASMQTHVWALLEPEGMKALLRLWLLHDPRIGVGFGLAGQPEVIAKIALSRPRPEKLNGYAANACLMFKTAHDYVRLTGDLAFLDEKLANHKSVLERLDELAMDWKGLVGPGSLLADYGEARHLLECAPAYIHRVPSFNAQNVLIMRQLASLHEFRGNAARGAELRTEATRLLGAVLDLYVPGQGVWCTVQNDGTRVDLRHCLDYVYLGKALAEDLSLQIRREMTDFFKNELMMPTWMRAMSLQDQSAAKSDRPDHGPMGSYPGWITGSVDVMWRFGYPREAFDFYCRTAAVTKEGPFTQSREFYGERKREKDAPVRMALRGGTMREIISGGQFADVVIQTFFGFAPTVGGESFLSDAATPRPFNGTLSGLRWKGELLKLVADSSGVHLEKGSAQ